ncbi:ExbD/TolR family protein [Foetidibacter luteolus]|uniref:ExbD/TolR family protein n=1 Tax=Foetidibacter luteolus TaxID=2608880 RepID=UPI00129B421B|nr:biopolymer transporter ExbD [Foetidibacter luteolus]
MAEINTQSPKKVKGTKGKKLSTRVDLTPMVDLGFLLLTFFIFNTTLAQPKVMQLILPADGVETNAAESKTLSLVLKDSNVIDYYHGVNMVGFKTTSYHAGGIRAVIQAKQQAVKKMFGSAAETLVLIKPTDKASYQNIVDALDEMAINDVKKYVLMDASKEELALMKP